jgi:hypothetical protein
VVRVWRKGMRGRGVVVTLPLFHPTLLHPHCTNSISSTINNNSSTSSSTNSRCSRWLISRHMQRHSKGGEGGVGVRPQHPHLSHPPSSSSSSSSNNSSL